MNLKSKLAIAASASLLMVGSVVAEESKWTTAEKVDLSTQKAKLGYTFGVQIGSNFVGQGMDKRVDVDAMVAAIRDMAAGIEPRLSNEEMQQAQVAFQQEMQAEQDKARAELVAQGEKNKAAGQKFLEENKATKGVKTTESGLQYNMIRDGKGKSPTAEDVIKVHYTGSLIDGTTFDSSYERGEPASFSVGAVIPGFAEGLQLMKEGGKIRLVIPEDQAYGLDGPPSIGPNQALVFEVELIEVTSQATSKKEG